MTHKLVLLRHGQSVWNLENLFKPPSPFAPKTEAEYDAKLDTLAEAITAWIRTCWRYRRSVIRRPSRNSPTSTSTPKCAVSSRSGASASTRAIVAS